MRLLVDGLFLRPGRVGGVEYMLYSLLTALTSAAGEHDEVRVLLPAGVDLSGRPFVDGVEQVTVESPANRFAAIERRMPTDYDVALFPNYYTPLRSAARRGRASVTVVHDLQFRSFPANFTPAKRAFQHAAVRVTARLATTVVAISEFTARELAEFQPVLRDRLEVVVNPIDWTRFAEEQAPPPDDLAGAPFFLLAAAQYRHKNIATAVAAFRRVHDRDPRVRLVLVGQVPAGLGESRVGADVPDTAGVVQLGFVPDETLAWLFRRATAVLLPSLYEGCGLPCAEALGLGTPVVHSGRGALPEVGGGLAASVEDPTDVDEWARFLTDAIAGRLAAPDVAAAAGVRAVHDPATVGARYWEVLRRAEEAAG